MENLDNKWVLNASTNDDCKEKDGNNPVTLGLENMRGVSENRDNGTPNSLGRLCPLVLRVTKVLATFKSSLIYFLDSRLTLSSLSSRSSFWSEPALWEELVSSSSRSFITNTS